MSSTTHDATTDSARCSDLDEKITLATGTNQIAGIAEFRPLTSSKKITYISTAFLPKIILKNSYLSKRVIVPRQK